MLVNKKLWEQSGHWEHYQDNMFKVEVEERDLQPQADELPGVDLRLPPRRSAPTATCRCASARWAADHRNERSGTLTGLVRVRQFTQDDAHIYCRPDQLQDEITGAARPGARVVQDLRSAAVLPAGHPAREAAGHRGSSGTTPSTRSTEALRGQRPGLRARRRRRRFYGPKIDIDVQDALGRALAGRHRSRSTSPCCPSASRSSTSTPTASRKRPVAIHRAIFGSYERFIGDPHRALRRRLPDLAGPGAGAGAAGHARSSCDYAARRSTRPCAPPGFGPSWTTATRSSATASATPRSARCHTCSSSASREAEQGTVSLRRAHRRGPGRDAARSSRRRTQRRDRLARRRPRRGPLVITAAFSHCPIHTEEPRL